MPHAICEVNRNTIINAVASGIAAAGAALTAEEAALLRHVAATESVFLWSDWRKTVAGIGLCGCPLTQAGVVTPDEYGVPPMEQQSRYYGFWQTFDKAMSPHALESLSVVFRVRD